jgi:hypothetical protein
MMNESAINPGLALRLPGALFSLFLPIFGLEFGGDHKFKLMKQTEYVYNIS